MAHELNIQCEWQLLQEAFEAGEVNTDYVRAEEDDDEDDGHDDIHDDIMWETQSERDNEENSFHQVLEPYLFGRKNPQQTDDAILDDEELFPNSPISVKDLCRYLLYLKASNASIGDRLFASIIGSLIRFMPTNNILAQTLKVQPTMYYIYLIRNVISNLNLCYPVVAGLSFSKFVGMGQICLITRGKACGLYVILS